MDIHEENPLNIRFAILGDCTALGRWQLRCLDELLAVADVRAVLRVELGAGEEPRTLPHTLPQALSSLPVLTLAQDSLERIRAYDLDFILGFGSGDCPPALLDSARHGVWAFRFGDWERYRGTSGGFWESYEAEPLTAALLVRLQHAAEAVVVLREGYVRTNVLSAARNLDQLLTRVARWPAQVCVDIQNGILDRLSSPPQVSRARPRAAPTRAELLAFKCRVLARTLRTLLRSLFRHDQWNVGLVDQPISSFLHSGCPADIRWLETPGRCEFRADPFGVWREERLTVLYEHFDYRANRGTIAAAEVDGDSVARAVRIGPQPAVHLSYPYLIEADGRLLCVPEASAAGEVGLYEIERFPDRWVKVADLLAHTPLVDATVFRHEGTWWLAGSEPTTQGTTCELHLWHAPEITGPWRAHTGNPVKIDVRSARSGGTPFHLNGALYRPAQDCSRSYGGRIVINRVVTLTPTAFREIEAAVVEPDPGGRYPAGLHTLSQAGGCTLIDAKRIIFSPAEFRRVLMHYLRLMARGGRRAPLKRSPAA